MRNLPLITIGVLALLGLACAAGREVGPSLLSPIPEVVPCVDSAETVAGYETACRPGQVGEVLLYPEGAVLLCRCLGGSP